jgi:hypothetical protein
MSSDNLTGADNQQERLDAYLAGFVDGYLHERRWSNIVECSRLVR